MLRYTYVQMQCFKHLPVCREKGNIRINKKRTHSPLNSQQPYGFFQLNALATKPTYGVLQERTECIWAHIRLFIARSIN